MLKDIFGYNFEAFQRYDKVTKLINIIMKTSKKLRESIREENSRWILIKIRST